MVGNAEVNHTLEICGFVRYREVGSSPAIDRVPLGRFSVVIVTFPEADFWRISVTSGDPLLSRIREVSDVGWWVIGLSSAELVSNSPELYPSRDETSW